MRNWLAYAGGTAVLVVGMAGLVVGLFGGTDPSAVWLAAAVAWLVQLVAYGALLAGGRARRFLMGWASGMALRFAAVAALALWVTRETRLDAASALLSLVGFVMVLVVLEPFFLRLAD